MAKSVNKVILVGNVGQDPEVKYTASGVPVAKVSLATNERFKDRKRRVARQDRMAHRCRLAAAGRGSSSDQTAGRPAEAHMIIMALLDYWRENQLKLPTVL